MPSIMNFVMPGKHVLWSSVEEWQTVYQLIFPAAATAATADTDEDAVTVAPAPVVADVTQVQQHWQQAIARISVWSVRGRLPIAIESTLGCLEALLQLSRRQLDDWSLRWLLASVVIRFVNGISDSYVQHHYYINSVAYSASQLGLPRMCSCICPMSLSRLNSTI